MAYQFLWIDGFDYEDDFSEVYASGLEYGENGVKFSGLDVPYLYGKATALNGSAENYIYKVLTGADFMTLFIAFHWYWDDTSDTNNRPFIEFWYGSSVLQVQVTRYYDTVTGQHRFKLWRGNGSALLASGAVGVTPGQWNWLSFRCSTGVNTGNFKMKINGITNINYSGATNNGSFYYLNRVKLTTGVAVGTGFRVDNLVIATGAPDDEPLPELRVLGAIVPTADDSVQFTPNTGFNWSNVDEIGPDEDATYNSSSTVGDTDTFSGVTSVVGDTIYAVKVNVRAKRDDAGARSFCPVIKPTTTVYEGAQTLATPDYFTYGHIWQTNPETGNPWTQAEINNLKWGYRLKG